MKRVFTFLLFQFSLLFAHVCNAQNVVFMDNSFGSTESIAAEMDTLDGHILIRTIERGYGSRFLKYSTSGELVQPPNGFEGIYYDKTTHILNNKVFYLGLMDQCDVLELDVSFKRLSSNLSVETNVSYSSILFGGLTSYQSVYPVFYPINNNQVAVAYNNRFFVLGVDSYNVAVQKQHPFGQANGVFPLTATADSVLIYGNSGIFIYRGDSISQLSETVTLFLEKRNDFYYAVGSVGIRKMDLDFNILATYPDIPQDIKFYNDKLYCFSLGHIKILDEELQYIEEGNVGNVNMDVHSFAVYDDMFFVGGRNRVTNFSEGSSCVIKSFSSDFESEDFIQDIGITDIELVSYAFVPGSVFGGSVMDYDLRLTADVTVNNFTDYPVSSAKALWKVSLLWDWFCPELLSTFSVDSIPPGGSTVLHINNAFFKRLGSLSNGSTMSVQVCMTSHAPDRKIDHNRSNDFYCETFNLLFVGVNENITTPINCFYNSVQDHIEIRNVSDAQVQLYSASGQLLQSQALMRGDNQLPMDKYSSGIYIVRIETKDGVSVVKVGKP